MEKQDVALIVALNSTMNLISLNFLIFLDSSFQVSQMDFQIAIVMGLDYAISMVVPTAKFTVG